MVNSPVWDKTKNCNPLRPRKTKGKEVVHQEEEDEPEVLVVETLVEGLGPVVVLHALLQRLVGSDDYQGRQLLHCPGSLHALNKF